MAVWLVLGLIAGGGEAQAARAALLVGIGRYAQAENLDGPPHDVAALQEMLTQTWGFKPNRVRTLVNAQATKEAILKELGCLETRTRPGDTVFVYFSCHGTSAFAPGEEVRQLDLDPFTGALVPADFRLGRDAAQTRDNLIIGRRDLRPILERLDRDRRVFAVVDACYAELALRSVLTGQFPRRYLKIPWYRLKNGPVTARSVTGVKEDLAEDDMIVSRPGRFNTPKGSEAPYPYQNLIYISASSKREPAVDINDALVKMGAQTVDNKPHGALTNALLAGLSGWADSDRDGVLTYRELHCFCRREVAGKWPHTPQLQYNRDRNSADGPVFGVRPAKLVMPPARPSGELRVKVESLPQDLARRISGLAKVRMVDHDHELLISRTGAEYVLSLPSGTPLAGFPVQDRDGLVERIRRRARIKELVALETPQASFNVFLEVTGRPGVILEGDLIGFRIKTGEAAHILLLNVNPAGRVSVIYPADESEPNRFGAGQTLDLADMGRISPPLGTDYLKVLAFRTKPGGYESFLGADFRAEDPRLDSLLEMIRSAGSSAAQATLSVTTARPGDMKSLLH